MTKLIIEIVHLATFSLLPLGSSPSFVEFLIQENLNDFKSNCLFNSLMVTELSTSTLKPGGVLPRILGEGVPHGSQNPDSISDQTT